MSDRVKEAFESLMAEMEDPPDWKDLTPVQIDGEPPRRRVASGPLLALGVATTTVVLVGAIALVRPRHGPGDVLDAVVGQWTAVEAIPMNILSGAVVEAVEAGIVVLQPESTTLIGFDGSTASGDRPPLPIQSGCCGSAVGIPVGEDLILIDGYVPHAWLLEIDTMSWREIEPRPWTGEILGSALIGDQLYIVNSAPRAGAGQSLVAGLDINTWSWQELEQVPSGISVGGVTTDGDSLIVAGTRQGRNNNILSSNRNPLVYQYNAASGWRQLPEVPIDGQASTVIWVEGAGLLAWNYDLNAALLDESNEWKTVGAVPMDFAECYPRSLPLGNGVMADCGGLAYFEVAARSWVVIPTSSSSWYVAHEDSVFELQLLGNGDQVRLSEYRLR